MTELTQDQQIHLMLALEGSIDSYQQQLQDLTSFDYDPVRNGPQKRGLLEEIRELNALYELVADAHDILIEPWPANTGAPASSLR